MTDKKEFPMILPPEIEQARSVQEAIAMIKELKRKKQAQADAAAGGAELPGPENIQPRKLGRPPKVKPDTQSAAPEPVSGPPAKRGRKSKSVPEAMQPSFGVAELTAHRPLGLLEVQEKVDLDALLADPRLSPHIAMRLDDHFALVLPASLERLQAALLKVGHTPKLTGNKLTETRLAGKGA